MDCEQSLFFFGIVERAILIRRAAKPAREIGIARFTIPKKNNDCLQSMRREDYPLLVLNDAAPPKIVRLGA